MKNVITILWCYTCSKRGYCDFNHLYHEMEVIKGYYNKKGRFIEVLK